MRGRKPTPTVQLKLRGSWRAKERRGEPQPPPGAPPMPNWLDDEGQKAWRRLVDILSTMHVLTVADGDALALIANNESIIIRSALKVRETGGEVVKSVNGFPIINPYLSTYNRALEQNAKLLAEFGLTPSSRSRVKAATTQRSRSGLAKFLEGSA